MQTNFYQYDWLDAEIVNILIDCDRIELLINLDITEHTGLPKSTPIKLICTGVVGLTDLCMWEDTDIFKASLAEISDRNTTFLSKVSETYSLSNEPLLDLAVELSNHITFHIYCYGVQAERS
jgi:hypothetical protein